MRAPRHEPGLWAVVGATGTGKTTLSLGLAEALGARGIPVEIINADAMQLYRGMDIGTAKLPEHERRGIPHRMLDVLDVTDEAAVAWYQTHARTAVQVAHGRGADAVLVGGSGLYVSSVIYDFEFPPRDLTLRAELEHELAAEGTAALFAKLEQQDPITAARIDPMNGRRIVRALEILAQGSDTHGAALPASPELWHPHTHVIGTHIERASLVSMLDERVEEMWRSGLVDEAAMLRRNGIERGVTARRAIGYAQALAQLDGTLTEPEAIGETQRLTRRYARRQVAWFKRYRQIDWVDPRTHPVADILSRTLSDA